MTIHHFSTGILVVHWLVVVGLSLRVIMRRPSVGTSLGWLAVIASAPFIGAGIYLLFGERRLGRGRAARIAGNAKAVTQWQDTLRNQFGVAEATIDPKVRPLHHHAERLLGFPALAGNQLDLLDNFESVFDALIADIDRARSTCHLCFYIWHQGGRAAEVVEALVRAAERGVQCRALADGTGSRDFLRSAQAHRLRSAGVELVTALPTGLLRTLFVRRDLRNHRKIVVIDDRIAYTGSQNLVDPRFFKQGSGVGEWVDAIARLTGPAATALDGVFAQDWSVETGERCELPGMADHEAPTPPETLVQVIPSGPDRQPEAIHQLLLTAIYSARRDLVMTTPYFVPDDAVVTALLSAALRGVEVTLIVPARNDSRLVRHASAAHYDDLLSAGVRLALFEGGLLHTKSLTIDGALSIFGSVNLDMRSLWLNFEISLFVYDAPFASQLHALQNTYLTNSTLLNLDEWRRRPAWRRLAENTCRLLGPLL